MKLITHYSSLITHPSLLITHHSLLIPPYSLLITHHSSLITHHSLLITHHSLLITLNSYPRVEESVDGIGCRVDQDISHRYGENTSLGQLVVALVDAVDQQRPDSGP